MFLTFQKMEVICISLLPYLIKLLVIMYPLEFIKLIDMVMKRILINLILILIKTGHGFGQNIHFINPATIEFIAQIVMVMTLLMKR